MVELRLLELEDRPLRGRVRDVRTRRIDMELGQRVRMVLAGGGAVPERRPVVHEQAPVGREVGVKGETEKAPLVVVGA